MVVGKCVWHIATILLFKVLLKLLIELCPHQMGQETRLVAASAGTSTVATVGTRAKRRKVDRVCPLCEKTNEDCSCMSAIPMPITHYSVSGPRWINR